MPSAYLVLLIANAIYGTSYVTSRVVLQDVPPAALAVARLALGAAVIVPFALAGRQARDTLSRSDRWRVFWMGVLGFAGAFGFGNLGIAHSTATNAALLITVEPVSLILLSPIFLGERLSRRELAGAALTVLGATLVVLNALPGSSAAFAPHWRGDLLLVLSGLCYAGYSLIGRNVLARHAALPVTAWSIVWGLLAMLPLAGLEWLDGRRPSGGRRRSGGPSTWRSSSRHSDISCGTTVSSGWRRRALPCSSTCSRWSGRCSECGGSASR